MTLALTQISLLQPKKWSEHTTHTNTQFLNSALFLMRNCFAHFREVRNGLQAFGVNTQVYTRSSVISALQK